MSFSIVSQPQQQQQQIRKRILRYQYKNPQKFCRRCNALLSPGINWRFSKVRCGNYICKSCINKTYPRSKKTPQQIKQWNRTYYYRDIQKSRERSRLNYQKHKAHKLEYMKQYRLRNKDRVNAYAREYHNRRIMKEERKDQR